MIQELLGADPLRRQALERVAELDLPDGWIAAGFVRDAVWDHLHGYPVSKPQGDIDVVWFGEDPMDAASDQRMERRLSEKMPGLEWSVKNQARMHSRNGDSPYRSVADAMTCWPETATAIAARLDRAGSIEISAPLGLDDLLSFQLRPGPRFRREKLPVFLERAAAKNWINRYPKLEMTVSATGAFSRSRQHPH
ncbi:MAG: nucleotidyltransferase family protein [Pseudomonadota bacterium]